METTIKQWFEEGNLLQSQLAKGKCPDCGNDRFRVIESKLIATVKVTLDFDNEPVADVRNFDDRNSKTSIRCEQCDRLIYED